MRLILPTINPIQIKICSHCIKVMAYKADYAFDAISIFSKICRTLQIYLETFYIYDIFIG